MEKGKTFMWAESIGILTHNQRVILGNTDSGEWIKISQECYHILQKVMQQQYTVQEVLNQCDGIDGRYVLSDADKELGISKNMDIVFDIFSIDINSKKIINKLYEEMQKVAYSEKVNVKTQEIAQSIQRYILELEQETDYILTFTEDVDWMAIFKALRVQHEVIEEDYFEKLIRYIKVATVVMKYKIFVFVNLRSYLSDLQMQKLIQEAIYQEVKLIFVENYVKDCMEGGLRYIIDRDQCEIY